MQDRKTTAYFTNLLLRQESKIEVNQKKSILIEFIRPE